MKKLIKIYGLLFLTIIAVTRCGSSSKNVDVCRCLTEPGNTEWNQENKEACDDAISKEIGVDDWKKLNMSQDPEVSAKWDALAKRCQVNKVDFKEIFKDFTQDNNQNIIITVGYINDTPVSVKHDENSKVITLVKIIGNKNLLRQLTEPLDMKNHLKRL